MAVIIPLPRKTGFHEIDTKTIKDMKAAERPDWTHRHFARDFAFEGRMTPGIDLCAILFVVLLLL